MRPDLDGPPLGRYYVNADDGLAPGEPVECFNPAAG
jgi:hypothetical protein